MCGTYDNRRNKSVIWMTQVCVNNTMDIFLYSTFACFHFQHPNASKSELLIYFTNVYALDYIEVIYNMWLHKITLRVSEFQKHCEPTVTQCFYMIFF